MLIHYLHTFTFALALMSSTPTGTGRPLEIPQIIEMVVNDELVTDSAQAAELTLVPFAGLIVSNAKLYRLPPALIAAVIQEESRFDPWAERAEPSYVARRAVRRNAQHWISTHPGSASFRTELGARARSMGLMQVMGEVAREQGFDPEYLSALFSPEHSIDQGCRLLRRLLDRYPRDTLAAISAYNQGSAHRKVRHGEHAFLNARYVYRVMVAWRAYRTLFTQGRRGNE